jgi:hypothetical protein
MITSERANDYLYREFINVICKKNETMIRYDYQTRCPAVGQDVPGMPNIEIHLLGKSMFLLEVSEYFIFPVDKKNTDPTIGIYGVDHWQVSYGNKTRDDIYGQLFIQKYGLHIKYTREAAEDDMPDRILMTLYTNSSTN